MTDSSVFLEVHQVYPDLTPSVECMRHLAGRLSLTDALLWCGRLNLIVSNPFNEEGKAWFRRALRQRYEYVDGRLQKNEFLSGSSFTAADAYLFVVTNWAGRTGVDLQNLGALDAFMNRVRAREAVQKALVAEGLVQKAA